MCAFSGVLLAQEQTQQSSSSSSSPQSQAQDDSNPTARPRAAQVRAGGASITLEVSEPLFDLGVALNVCGYDYDLDKSMPVRAKVRDEINQALMTNAAARDSRDALCQYMNLHRLNDTGLNVGQYVSLALYLSPPPELQPNVELSELPPQAAQVAEVLPRLRAFASDINLHYIWLQHRAEYEALVERVHDPMTTTVLDTNIFLHLPVSSYDGRRFLVLLEPMLSPALTNARIYGNDYIIVTSPENVPADKVPVHLDQIRHIYLHYLVEPMIYSRGTAMERMQPILRAVADAPLDFVYKSDSVALLTECLIKAIEARMFKIAGPEPQRPHGVQHSRVDDDNYVQLRSAYDRQTAIERQRLVELDETQGWVLTGYFYQALDALNGSGTSLSEQMAPMIYGMDIQHEMNLAKNIVFAKTASTDPLRPSRIRRQMTGIDLAEMAMATGKLDDAAELASAELSKPGGDKGRATYVLARLDLMKGKADEAQQGFQHALKLSHDPRTLAWSHIYLGRMYDTMTPPAREKAVAEYEAALANRDSRSDTKEAAESGVAKPFALPQRGPGPTRATQAKPGDDDDKDFDPTGKAEKETYKPPPTTK